MAPVICVSTSPEGEPVLARLLQIATVLPALLLIACGGNETPPEGGQSASQTTGTAGSSTTTAPGPSVSGKTSTIETSNVCTDATGDAKTNDLRTVSLKRNGDHLSVTWNLVKRDTGAGTAGFYLNVASEDGNAAGQLGVTYNDGHQSGYFTFRDTNKEIPGEAPTTRTSVTGSFPMAELQAYGPNFTWSAATTRNGKDVDACPDSTGDILNPAKLRFAG
jgi:hypothetical protein